jgi:hypothetical protein
VGQCWHVILAATRLHCQLLHSVIQLPSLLCMLRGLHFKGSSGACWTRRWVKHSSFALIQDIVYLRVGNASSEWECTISVCGGVLQIEHFRTNMAAHIDHGIAMLDKLMAGGAPQASGEGALALA